MLLARISDRVQSSIEFAQTARRELHSSLLVCLKKSESGNPERAECEEAPRSRHTENREQNRKGQRHSKGDDPRNPPAVLATRSDVGGLNGWSRLPRAFRERRC
jgi:hypothetical protein